MLEERTCGTPTLGVIPFIEGLRLPEEDAASLPHPALSAPGGPAGIEIAVIRLPHISNFDDCDALAAGADVHQFVSWIPLQEPFGRRTRSSSPAARRPLPTSAWLSARGFPPAVRALADKGTAVVGICAGYQILGLTVRDPAAARALRVLRRRSGLPVGTELASGKITRRARATVTGGEGFWARVPRSRDTRSTGAARPPPPTRPPCSPSTTELWTALSRAGAGYGERTCTGCSTLPASGAHGLPPWAARVPACPRGNRCVISRREASSDSRGSLPRMPTCTASDRSRDCERFTFPPLPGVQSLGPPTGSDNPKEGGRSRRASPVPIARHNARSPRLPAGRWPLRGSGADCHVDEPRSASSHRPLRDPHRPGHGPCPLPAQSRPAARSASLAKLMSLHIVYQKLEERFISKSDVVTPRPMRGRTTRRRARRSCTWVPVRS